MLKKNWKYKFSNKSRFIIFKKFSAFAFAALISNNAASAETQTIQLNAVLFDGSERLNSDAVKWSFFRKWSGNRCLSQEEEIEISIEERTTSAKLAPDNYCIEVSLRSSEQIRARRTDIVIREDQAPSPITIALNPAALHFSEVAKQIKSLFPGKIKEDSWSYTVTSRHVTKPTNLTAHETATIERAGTNLDTIEYLPPGTYDALVRFKFVDDFEAVPPDEREQQVVIRLQLEPGSSNAPEANIALGAVNLKAHSTSNSMESDSLEQSTSYVIKQKEPDIASGTRSKVASLNTPSSFAILPAGSYIVEAIHGTAFVRSNTVTVAAGEVTEVHLDMNVGGLQLPVSVGKACSKIDSIHKTIRSSNQNVDGTYGPSLEESDDVKHVFLMTAGTYRVEYRLASRADVGRPLTIVDNVKVTAGKLNKPEILPAFGCVGTVFANHFGDKHTADSWKIFKAKRVEDPGTKAVRFLATSPAIAQGDKETGTSWILPAGPYVAQAKIGKRTFSAGFQVVGKKRTEAVVGEWQYDLPQLSRIKGF